MCEIFQIITHSGITVYSQSFQSTKNNKRIYKVNMYTHDCIRVKQAHFRFTGCWVVFSCVLNVTHINNCGCNTINVTSSYIGT